MKDLKIFANTLDPAAQNQIYDLMAQSSFEGARVRIMPDVHCGIGCVVGFTSTMTDKAIPNVIGVDIGCGMLTVELGKIDIDLKALDGFIKTNIPSGMSICKTAHPNSKIINDLYCYSELRKMDRLVCSMGSLGGGNHFIEVDGDEDGNKYLIIHSGSRNLGMQVASIYQNLAVERCKSASFSEREELISTLKAEGRTDEIPEKLTELTKKYAYKTKIPADLCYLDGIDLDKYLHDMRICIKFAKFNRQAMADKIIKHLGVLRTSSFETIHNFIDENNVIRKGAVPAHSGQRILIPMNMRDGCLIAIGLGNEDWNCSAPHGAGRLYSRSAVKELFTVDEYRQSMEGIYTTSVCDGTLDESPMAYKPMDEILSIIGDTVKIEKIIKPIYNFKAS